MLDDVFIDALHTWNVLFFYKIAMSQGQTTFICPLISIKVNLHKILSAYKNIFYLTAKTHKWLILKVIWGCLGI